MRYILVLLLAVVAGCATTPARKYCVAKDGDMYIIVEAEKAEPFQNLRWKDARSALVMQDMLERLHRRRNGL